MDGSQRRRASQRHEPVSAWPSSSIAWAGGEGVSEGRATRASHALIVRARRRQHSLRTLVMTAAMRAAAPRRAGQVPHQTHQAHRQDHYHRRTARRPLGRARVRLVLRALNPPGLAKVIRCTVFKECGRVAGKHVVFLDGPGARILPSGGIVSAVFIIRLTDAWRSR